LDDLLGGSTADHGCASPPALLQCRLLPEPSRHPSFHLLLRDGLALLDVLPSALDLLSNVDPVLNLFEGGVVWNLIQDLAHFVFRALHRRLQTRRQSYPSDHDPQTALAPAHFLVT